MELNDAGVALVKRFEGCRLTAYKDVVGILTIGYGHTGVDVYDGMEINQPMADLLLKRDVADTAVGVKKALTCSLNDNQFSALVCFAFNVGVHAFAKSTLCSLLQHKDLLGASEQFARWNKAGGIERPGLTERRLAEKALFLA